MEQALSLARQRLLEHKEDPFKSGKTGIEPDLIGRFLDEMIELNRFMYTTSSTNCPYNLAFQEMFVGGYIERPRLTDTFITKLKELKYSYFIRNFNTGELVKYLAPGSLASMLEYEKLNPYRLRRFEEELGYRHHPLNFIRNAPQWSGPELNDDTKTIEDQILKGDIVELFVVNYTVPLDRNLYSELIKSLTS